MLRRGVDVFFQRCERLLVVLFAVPLLAAAAGYLLGNTYTVTAHLWVDSSPRVVSVLQMDPQTTTGPALAESNMLRELVAADSFLNRVLGTADPPFNRLPADQKESLRSTVRAALTIDSDGQHLVTITYVDRSAPSGEAFVNTVIADFNAYLVDLENPPGPPSVTQSQLVAAKAAVDAAAQAVSDYSRSFRGDAAALASDPQYLTLSARARSQAAVYSQLLIADQQRAAAASSTGSQALFRIVDPPAAVRTPLSTSHPIVRFFAAGLLAAAGVIGLVVYVMGVRDPRLLSGDDLQRLGLAYLGSTRPA